jgi:hypothetical protein
MGNGNTDPRRKKNFYILNGKLKGKASQGEKACELLFSLNPNVNRGAAAMSELFLLLRTSLCLRVSRFINQRFPAKIPLR